MEKIEFYSFNIFNVREHTNGGELETVLGYLFAKEGIFEDVPLNKQKFFGFCKKISSLYNDVSYHNKTHAADLTQTFYNIVTDGELGMKTGMDKFELMCYLLSGCCHDVEHLGFNNLYMVETRHEIANRYNDVSVMENHHIATTFRVMNENDGEFDIFDQFDSDQYKLARMLMIGAILATDMSEHFAKFGQFKGKVLDPDFDPETADNKKMLCEFLFHLSDISNATKPYDICQKWTDLLFEEFFN